jgi:hypothetical protein
MLAYTHKHIPYFRRFVLSTILETVEDFVVDEFHLQNPEQALPKSPVALVQQNKPEGTSIVNLSPLEKVKKVLSRLRPRNDRGCVILPEKVLPTKERTTRKNKTLEKEAIESIQVID